MASTHTEITSEHLYLDFSSPAFTHDPYAFYDQLRTQAPIYNNPKKTFFFLSRYNDVLSTLKHSETFRSNMVEHATFREIYRDNHNDLCPMGLFRQHSMITNDEPVHKSQRGLVQSAFTTKALEALQPFIKRVTNHLLDDILQGNGCDFTAAFATPLPTRVISELLGIPKSDRSMLEAWAKQSTILFEPDAPRIIHQQNAVMDEAMGYFQSFYKKADQTQITEVLGRLLVSAAAANKISFIEVVANAVLFFVAGHETTVNLLANGLYLLLSHEDQKQQLLAHINDDTILDSTIDECLRYESPVKVISRFAISSTCISGHEVERGQAIHCGLAAANRDPEMFSEPHKFQITRQPNRHLAFGLGPHYCIGALLGRLEAKIAFSELFKRFPKLRLANQQIKWAPSNTFRRLESLEVVI